MKDYSNFLTEKPFSCNVDGCSMASKFTNEDHLTVHKKRHDMVLNLGIEGIGLGQKVTTFTDQTPTPTQFIRNCEEVGLFQDLQNVNPFEETFKKAVEAVKSGQLSLEKSFQSTPPDDTLHTPNVFPHITDVPNINHSDICNKPENIPPCEEELLKHDINENEKNCSADITTAQHVIQSGLGQSKKEFSTPISSTDSSGSQSSGESKVILNVPEGHLVQLLTPDDSQSACNMIVIKNTVTDLFSPLPVTVKEKLKKTLSEKKTGKTLQHKVPILKCPVKRTSNSLSNKFSKFSKNAMKLISKLESSNEDEVSGVTPIRQKKGNKGQSKESRSEFLARSRAASSRCRERKKMYLLYLEKVNSELSTSNQNLILMNSLLRQEINELHRELLKHKNCNAADKNTEAALTTAANFIGKKTVVEKTQVRLQPQVVSKSGEISCTEREEFVNTNEDFVAGDLPESQTDPNLFSFDVAEVILSDEPDESEIPLNEESKPPDIIVHFNSVGNDFPATLPLDFHLDRYIERTGGRVKQIYGEHSYYLKKSSVNIDKRIMSYKTFRETMEPPIASEECRKLNALQMKQMKQNDAFRDLTSLNSKVLIGPRTPPPLILLKPFKKRTLQNKRNEKT